MIAAHKWIGLLLVALFLLVGVSGLIFWFRNRHPGEWFWKLVAAGQAGLALQAISGIILFVAGGRRSWLHYAYGGFPIVVLVAAHRYSRRLEGIAWVAFALAGLVNFGLLLRGFMTGIGV